MKKQEIPKILLYTTGIPGAGKTEFSTKLETITNAKHVSLDALAYELFAIPNFNSEKDRSLVMNLAEERVEDYLWGDYPVVYDGNINTPEMRAHLKRLSKKYKVPLICVYINTPEEISKQRAMVPRFSKKMKAWRVVSPEQFEAKVEEFVLPNDKDSFVQVLGTESFDNQLKKILDYISDIKA